MLSQLTYGLTHIPEVIIPLFQSVGNWGYLCLFLITFMETGLVVFPWLFKRLDGPNLERARIFFERHGIKSVIFGRFVPLIRTFVPLIAGSSGLKARRFLIGNLIGSALWVLLAGVAGYYFGTISFVKDHFSLVLLGLICVSFLPAAIVWGINHLRRHIIMKKGSF
ncbi:MAG: VTT domain-containing protein [Limosilactobacillus fermentum]